MDQAWKKPAIDIKPGSIIKGKWHKQRYTVKRKLGSGAIGTVFLCDRNGENVALKMSEKSTSMTMEVNVLKSLNRVQDRKLGPSLLDVDDWQVNPNTKYAFYVMEYLQGEPLERFIRRHGNDWVPVFMLQLLDDLEQLHQAGWVFGDFKSENLIVLYSPPRVRWIDVGGTTQIGRSIKEYTEFYDRGYWGMGTRRAEPSYDLFAFVMVMLNIYYPNRFEKGNNPKVTLLKRIENVKQLRSYKDCFQKAVLGKYQSSAQMKDDLLHLLHAAKTSSPASRRVDKKGRNTAFYAEASGIAAIALLYYLSSLFM